MKMATMEGSMDFLILW